MDDERYDALIADLERANRLLAETEEGGLHLVCYLVMAAGGQIRIPRSLFAGTKALNLDRSDDPVTDEMIFTVTEL